MKYLWVLTYGVQKKELFLKPQSDSGILTDLGRLDFKHSSKWIVLAGIIFTFTWMTFLSGPMSTRSEICILMMFAMRIIKHNRQAMCLTYLIIHVLHFTLCHVEIPLWSWCIMDSISTSPRTSYIVDSTDFFCVLEIFENGWKLKYTFWNSH